LAYGFTVGVPNVVVVIPLLVVVGGDGCVCVVTVGVAFVTPRGEPLGDDDGLGDPLPVVDDVDFDVDFDVPDEVVPVDDDVVFLPAPALFVDRPAIIYAPT
tara:strand:+ start:112 stop:414 length:303 start_codon:yes stop_codon:yes gene_type:complete